MITSTSADAAGLIRDAETEALIRDYAKPIFNAAGLGSQGIQIHLVNDRAFNAFVVDGHNMFMHAGTLMDAKTPNQVIGVIAHESGHITGGHLARLRTQVSRAKSAALMLQLLGFAAMAAGAVAGAPGDGTGWNGDRLWRSGRGPPHPARLPPGRGVVGRPGRRRLPQRHQAVRQAACSRRSSSWPSKLIGVQGINPYLQTHPLPQQRLVQLRALVTASPYYNNTDPPELQFRHDLMKAKLFGFLDDPQTVFNRYPADRPEPARALRQGDRHLPQVRRQGRHAAA